MLIRRPVRSCVLTKALTPRANFVSLLSAEQPDRRFRAVRADGLGLGTPWEGEGGADRGEQCHAGGDAHAQRHRADEGAVRGADQFAALQSANVLADDGDAGGTADFPDRVVDGAPGAGLVRRDSGHDGRAGRRHHESMRLP